MALSGPSFPKSCRQLLTRKIKQSFSRCSEFYLNRYHIDCFPRDVMRFRIAKFRNPLSTSSQIEMS